jgi:hypothetical protein
MEEDRVTEVTLPRDGLSILYLPSSYLMFPPGVTAMNRSLAIACLSSALLLPLASGCALFGYVASVVPSAPVKARYEGLKGQRVAVLTWADRASTFDFPTLQSDVTMSVQAKLAQAASPAVKTEELAGTTFVEARQVVRWQKNHPELEMRSLTEVAPKAASALGCTRLVYVELSPFTIHDPRTPILLKGMATATIRVAEVSGGVAKIVYEEAGLTVEFPEHAPEGVPPTDQMTPQYIYKGLIDAITTDVAVRFFSTSDN